MHVCVHACVHLLTFSLKNFSKTIDWIFTKFHNSVPNIDVKITGRLAQLVERRTREHNVSGLYRCGFESPAGQLKLLIVFQMRC